MALMIHLPTSKEAFWCETAFDVPIIAAKGGDTEFPICLNLESMLILDLPEGLLSEP